MKQLQVHSNVGNGAGPSTGAPLAITIRDGTVVIRALDFHDDVVATYLATLAEQDRATGIVHCLHVGASALTFASDQTGASLLANTMKTSAESHGVLLREIAKAASDSVEQSAEVLLKGANDTAQKIVADLAALLNPNDATSIIGKLERLLVDGYAQVTRKAREDLDVANPCSPLSILRAELERNEERRHSEIMKQVAELLQQQAAKAAASAERAKSTRKGCDFETATGEFLEGESRPRKDLARYTGSEVGVAGNMKGDYVVEIDPADGRDLRVVLELKNASKTTSALVKELDKAIENRAAQFGIALVTDPSPITQAIVPYGDDKLLVRVPALPDGDGWDYTALSVALEGARWKTIMGRTTSTSLDINRIEADIEAAFTIANRVTEAKRRITAGKSHFDTVLEYLDAMRRDLIAALQRIRDAVSDNMSNEEAL